MFPFEVVLRADLVEGHHPRGDLESKPHGGHRTAEVYRGYPCPAHHLVDAAARQSAFSKDALKRILSATVGPAVRATSSSFVNVMERAAS